MISSDIIHSPICLSLGMLQQVVSDDTWLGIISNVRRQARRRGRVRRETSGASVMLEFKHQDATLVIQYKSSRIIQVPIKPIKSTGTETKLWERRQAPQRRKRHSHR